jgi:16S rRNA (guanine527-N7)-methyltransferase
MDDAPLDDADDRLRRFAAAVAASPHNLVSRTARDQLLSRHVPESIRLAHLLPGTARRLLDVGSGGGFPGMVLAIVRPELEVHLLDSTAKKTRFLTETADELGVDVTVHTGRAEDLAKPPLAGSFDVVTARAVAPLDRLLPWTLPFLHPDGLLYAIKGDRWVEELEQATSVLGRLGGRVVATPEDQAGDRGTDPQPRVVIIARAR